MNLIKKVMLSNASTPSFGLYAQLSSVVEPATLPLRSWTYRPKYGIESFKLILNTYLTNYCCYKIIHKTA